MKPMYREETKLYMDRYNSLVSKETEEIYADIAKDTEILKQYLI